MQITPLPWKNLLLKWEDEAQVCLLSPPIVVMLINAQPAASSFTVEWRGYTLLHSVPFQQIQHQIWMREIQIWSTDWGGKNDAPERPAQIIASILLIQSLLWVLLTGLLQKHSKSSLFIKFSRHLCYNEHIPTHLYGFSRHLRLSCHWFW